MEVLSVNIKKELLQNRRTARAAIDAAEKKAADLRAKRDSLGAELDGLKAAALFIIDPKGVGFAPNVNERCKGGQ